MQAGVQRLVEVGGEAEGENNGANKASGGRISRLDVVLM